MKRTDYTAPVIEVIAVATEKGYATSYDTPIAPWEQDNF